MMAESAYEDERGEKIDWIARNKNCV